MNETTKRWLLLFLILTSLSLVQGMEIRGPIAEVVDGAVYEWDARDFAGFYYDADDDLGTEKITLAINDRALQEGGGVIYQTSGQENYFEFEDWGAYYSMAFLGEVYFAAYAEVDDEFFLDYLASESQDRLLLANGQLTRILENDDRKHILSTSSPLLLEDGYELRLGGVDPQTKKTYVELYKNGSFVDLKALEPLKDGATMADKTYIYRADLGGTKDIVIMAAHIKGVFHARDEDFAVVNGLLQISDRPITVDEGSKFGKMTVSKLRSDESEMVLEMSNLGERFILNRNRDLPIMDGYKIKTADQDIWAEEPLRFYIYRELASGDVNETKEDLETLKEVQASYSAEVISVTEPQTEDFAFDAWGKYSTVLYQGEEYFAGYLEEIDDSWEMSHPYARSRDDYPLEDEELSEVLMNDDQERVISSDSPLELEEGYLLSLHGVDDLGWVWLTLYRDGELVDQDLIRPAGEYTTMADKTYVYKRDLGLSKDIVTIAVHFSSKTFKGSEKGLSDMATVDGVWQISDIPLKAIRI